MISVLCVVLRTCESLSFYPLHLSDSLINETNDVSVYLILHSLDKILDVKKCKLVFSMMSDISR